MFQKVCTRQDLVSYIRRIMLPSMTKNTNRVQEEYISNYMCDQGKPITCTIGSNDDYKKKNDKSKRPLIIAAINHMAYKIYSNELSSIHAEHAKVIDNLSE